MASVVYRDVSVDSTHDLVLSGGDLVLTLDLDAIAQDLDTQLRFVAGEHFLYPDQGMPLYTQVLVKNPNVNTVRSLLRSTILGVLGVTRLLSMQLTYIGKTRLAQVSFIADTDVGVIDRTITLGS